LFLKAFAYFNGKENAKKKKENRLLFGKYVIMTLAIFQQQQKNTLFSSCLSECPGKPWHANSEQPELHDKHA